MPARVEHESFGAVAMFWTHKLGNVNVKRLALDAVFERRKLRLEHTPWSFHRCLAGFIQILMDFAI